MIIYVLGEIIVEIVIDPVQKRKRVIAEIAYRLIHYSHVFKLASSEEPSGRAAGETIGQEKEDVSPSFTSPFDEGRYP